MRWPWNGMLMIANVVTVPHVGQFDELGGRQAGGRVGPVRWEVHLPVFAGFGAQQLALFETARKRAIREANAVCWISMLLGGRLDRHRVTVVGRFGNRSLGLGRRRAKSSMSVIAPPVRRPDGRAPARRCRSRRRSSVDGVSGDVGAVELDQCPGEWPVQRCPSRGSGCQVHDSTVPTLATGSIRSMVSSVGGRFGRR